MPKRTKAVAGNTVSVMDAVERATKEANEKIGKLQTELAQQKPLIREAAHALGWALKHPDYLPGGRFHQGAIGTTIPVLKQLCDAAGVTFHADKMGAADVGRRERLLKNSALVAAAERLTAAGGTGAQVQTVLAGVEGEESAEQPAQVPAAEKAEQQPEHQGAGAEKPAG